MLLLDNQTAVAEYCEGLAYIAHYAESSGCDVIMSAGCIPVLVECLRRWPADEEVTHRACLALYRIASGGSDDVRAAIGSVPGIAAVLEAAAESGLDDGRASYALDALSLY